MQREIEELGLRGIQGKVQYAGSVQYLKDLSRKKSMDSTTELMPLIDVIMLIPGAGNIKVKD